MITAQQIKERLNEEKNPLRYLDEEIARSANLLGDQCQKVQDTISAFNNRTDKDEQIDLLKIREDLMKTGELYMDLNQYVKVRKEQVRQQKRAEQLSKAQAKRQQWMEQKGIKK